MIATLKGNGTKARDMILALARDLAPHSPCPHGCDSALTHAVMTAPEKRDPALVAKLDAVAGRVL